jgi:4-hydroxymandelate oxidase
MEKIINVASYHARAKDILSSPAWDYIDGAAEDESTRHENYSAFTKIKFQPRVLNDVSKRSLTTHVMGHKVSLPVLLGPTSPLKLAHPDAERAQIKAATNKGTIAVLSMDSHYTLEDVASHGAGNLWFQLYCYGNRALMEQVVVKAEKNGYSALVVTVDAFYPGRRERMQRHDFVMPQEIAMGNLTSLDIPPDLRRADGSIIRFPLTWKDFEWLRSITKLPIIVKGITHPDDALRAVDSGAEGIIVSNHGGRQVDYAVSTIDALPKIAARIGKHAELMLDGGISRGTDVIKAIALGAKAVLLGRAYIWGMTVAGQQGVEDVLDIFEREMNVAMAQLGLASIEEINSDIIF